MKIVYLWRRFSQATKLLMRCFRGVPGTTFWMQNQNIFFRKTFGDKIEANNEIQKVGPKWHLDIDNLTKICQKNVFQIFSVFQTHKKKSRVFLKISLVVDNHRPFKWLTDIFVGREICSQSRGIIFRKIFEKQYIFGGVFLWLENC